MISANFNLTFLSLPSFSSNIHLEDINQPTTSRGEAIRCRVGERCSTDRVVYPQAFDRAPPNLNPNLNPNSNQARPLISRNRNSPSGPSLERRVPNKTPAPKLFSYSTAVPRPRHYLLLSTSKAPFYLCKNATSSLHSDQQLQRVRILLLLILSNRDVLTA